MPQRVICNEINENQNFPPAAGFQILQTYARKVTNTAYSSL